MGNFDDEEEATRAYDVVAACLGKLVNFPAAKSDAAVKGSKGGSSVALQGRQLAQIQQPLPPAPFHAAGGGGGDIGRSGEPAACFARQCTDGPCAGDQARL